MKKLLLVATTLAATTLTVVGAAPAQASDTGYYLKRDRAVYLKPSCRTYGAPYLVPDNIASRRGWTLNAYVLDPAGREVGSYVLGKQAGDPASGTLRMQLCGGQRLGTYTITSKLTYSGTLSLLLGGSEGGTDTMVDTFRVRRA